MHPMTLPLDRLGTYGFQDGDYVFGADNIIAKNICCH